MSKQLRKLKKSVDKNMQWHAISFGAELIKFGYSKDEVAKIICDPSGNLQTAALKEIEGMTSDDV